MSRRRLLTGAAAGIGLVVAAGVGRAVASTTSVDRSASAQKPASRLEIPEFVPAPPTTIPSDSVPSTTVPSDTDTSDSVPSDSVPSDSVPSDSVPSNTVPAGPFQPPADGEILFPLALGAEWSAYVLDNYGDTRGRDGGYFHQGVDIMADEGTPQVAVVDGELTKRYESDFWGWTLLGDDGATYKYFHSAEDSNGWVQGDRVQQGDVIGFVSDSGTSVGNFHLHFEYRPGNTPADSYDKLQRVPGATFAG